MSDQADRDEAEEPRPEQARVTWQSYESVIDKRIARAQEQGLLENLPGQGQPQKLDDDTLVPEDLRAAFRLLKASGFAPPWIELRREIETGRAELAAWLARANERWPRLDPQQRARLRAEYRRKLDDLQRMIFTHNMTAPAAAGHLEGLRIPIELAKLGD